MPICGCVFELSGQKTAFRFVTVDRRPFIRHILLVSTMKVLLAYLVSHRAALRDAQILLCIHRSIPLELMDEGKRLELKSDLKMDILQS